MTPKEKAIELYDKYFFPHYVWENDGYQVDEKLTYEVRKRFSLIAVDEIIEATNMNQFAFRKSIPAKVVNHPFWQEVKQEIENL